MSEKKKNRFGGQATTDAEIRQKAEQAYASSGQAAVNRQQGIQTGQRVQQSRIEKTGSAAPSDTASKKRRFSGVELLQKASDALKGIDRLASTEAEMTFGKPYDPKASDSGRVENTLLAGGKGWTAGQANALAFLLDPTDDGSMSDLEMELDPTGAGKKLGENRVADFLNRLRGKASESLYGTANRLSDEAAESEEQAKKGLGKVGQILVDVGIAGTQLAADATIGRLTGAGMTTMGTRTFGQSAREALDNGANQQQAFNYGASSAAVEMLTEKLFDVGKIFGKGAGDELIEKAVEKWAKTDAGRSALRTFFGVLTESGEEAASGLVNPIIRQFCDSDAAKETYGTAEGRRQLASDIGRDALIGGILGGFGTVATGQNRAANAQIRANETARQQAAENARLADAAARTQAQNEALASNTMQTGTADAEAAAALERNWARANRPQTAQALSRVFGGQQITEAEADTILADTELMEQMLRATGTPVENGDLRGSFIRMMEQNGTPIIQTTQNATESPVTNAEAPKGNLPTGEVETIVQSAQRQNERQGGKPGAEIMRSAAGIRTFKDLEGERVGQVSPEDSTGAAPEGFDPYSNWQNQRGRFQPEGEKAVRQIDLPTENLQGQRTMKGGQTVMEAEVTPAARADEIAKAYVDGRMAYVSVGNEELAQNATAKIERDGFQKAYIDWTAAARSGKVTDELMAMGATLINNAGNAGMETKQYLDLVSDYVNMSHKAATALQAVRILKSLTPEARLYTMQRSIYSIAEECGIEDAQIPPELAEAYRNAPDEKTRDEVVTQIQKEIAKRVPSTLLDKWNALRYTNMLGNFKTQVRNLAGNTVMGLTASIKRRLQAAFGVIQNAAGGQRDVAVFYRPSLGTAAWNDFENVKAVAKGESKFSDISGVSRNSFLRGINDQRRIFKFLPLEAYRKVTQWAMEKGDDIFIRMTYADAMAQYLAAHGVKTTEQMQSAEQSVIDAARAYAIQEAQEATFHDDNGLSNWASKFMRGNDTPKGVKIISEGIMPFRKTPANILVRGVEYSPIGAAASLLNTVQAATNGADGKLGKAVNKATQKLNGGKNVTANDAINSWAKTATGTAVLMAGWALARAGKLFGAFDDDEQAAFEKLTGHQEYALEINGTSVTLDWCSPTVMPLLVGGELYRLAEDGGLNMKNMEAALSALADPMINMSMLQGVNDTLDSIKYSDNSLIQMGEKAVVSYFAQGLTNTLLGQLERTAEPNRMTTYADKEGGLSNWLQRELGKASAKTPGVDYNQSEYLNAWGKTQSNGELLARAANNLLNPSYVSKISTGRVDKELERLHDATGDDSIYPNAYSAPDSLKVGGTDRKLTQKQKETYQKTYGGIYSNGVNALLSAAGYREMSNADKVALLTSVEDYARDMAKQAVAPGYEVNSSTTKANEAEDSAGLSPVEYLLAAAQINQFNADGKGNIRQDEITDALDAMDLEDWQKAGLWALIGSNWKPEKNPYT